jgi:hypothetical protein
MTPNEAPPPQYEKGDTVYDSSGMKLGEVVHRYYNDYTGEWSYTLADNMSQYTGNFILHKPTVQK